MDNITEIVTVIVGVLGTAEYGNLEARLKVKAEQKEEIENNDGNQYRTIWKRVSKLEELLEESAKEKDELRASVLKLTEEVASLRTR